MNETNIFSAMCNLARKLENKEFGVKIEEYLSRQAIDYIAESAIKSIEKKEKEVKTCQ